jgi:NTE family protein
MTVAFVLTGGGSLGAVHVGMLEALYERGILPDLIVGTSVGAINGGYIASRPRRPATAQSLGDIWRGLRRPDIFPLDLAVGLFGFIGRRTHLIPDRALRKLMRDHLQFSDLGDARIPFHVIATDARTGEEVRLSSGPALDAVLASAALPGIFPPVQWQDRLLVDGGVANYAPISQAVAPGAERVYVLTSGTACARTEPPRGAIPLLLHSTSFLVAHRMALEVELHRDRADLIVLPPPCPLSVAPHDFGQANELISRSLQLTRTYLDDLAQAGTVCRPEHLARFGHREQGRTTTRPHQRPTERSGEVVVESRVA